VPLLGAGDPLPSRPHRVLVAGTSGAGKTTLAGAVAETLGYPYVELDSLHHGPGWTRRPEFEEDVGRVVAGSRWVSEWQYEAVRELLLDRADCLIWLDLPRALVTARVVRRTLRRRVRREVLWNSKHGAAAADVLLRPRSHRALGLAHPPAHTRPVGGRTAPDDRRLSGYCWPRPCGAP